MMSPPSIALLGEGLKEAPRGRSAVTLEDFLRVKRADPTASSILNLNTMNSKNAFAKEDLGA